MFKNLCLDIFNFEICAVIYRKFQISAMYAPSSFPDLSKLSSYDLAYFLVKDSTFER